ncbi:MAG TPA: aminotransferase class I/II-fold pyridoxal phosphate-dependent enzyme [Acidimicrobiia bacterium]|nr:aminotransferase class I/II-fold pyridoxal phosphate-dependent enzyme [Acidimicrobiia bacterium]
MTRIYLSPPDVQRSDVDLVVAAFDEGWIAPVGPQIDAFELDLAVATGRSRAVALSSGTAALHLALIVNGVSEGDRVLVSSLTFAASANAVRYVGANPVFVDSDRATWNMDPDLLASELDDAAQRNRRYAAVVVVDLYGQCADYRRIEQICAEHEIPVISDAAEALGARLSERPAGSFGEVGILSFNGNKIITTSGGGALVTNNEKWADEVRFLATQARDPALHYEHSRVGYNYRLSNLLAALGRSQLSDLPRRVARRRAHNQAYRAALEGIPGIEFMPEISDGKSTFWLTALTVDPVMAGVDRTTLINHLGEHDIEARPVWKPMHMQPLYRENQVIRGEVSADLFERGLCLPSGSSLSGAQREQVVEAIRAKLPVS